MDLYRGTIDGSWVYGIYFHNKKNKKRTALDKGYNLVYISGCS